MADVTIYHNPNCGTSRNALAMIRAAGHAPQVVEYLKAGWTRAQLESLFAAMGVTPRQMLREKDAAAAGLDPAADDAAILDAMVAHPVLVQRPIVVTERGTVLARPAERVQDLL
jgi:arsenate reductase